ncbi:hypothetical protein QTP70_009840 [Hemibagrus guttatus]|uniref:Uncharacterized protein n=1 Tax=Hemibagrus guttatus TaxID=175788 RepID=A0AAE0UM51_9TELE|nr:hypothetical protein QTP70_009840 [Hemibagrus guttatus]
MEQWRTFPGVAGRPKLPQEHSDNSSRRSQKTPQQHPKNCRPHLPQLRSRDVAMGPGSGPSGDDDDARVPRTATSPTFWHNDETISRGADQQPPMDPCSSTSKSNSLVSRHG